MSIKVSLTRFFFFYFFLYSSIKTNPELLCAIQTLHLWFNSKLKSEWDHRSGGCLGGAWKAGTHTKKYRCEKQKKNPGLNWRESRKWSMRLAASFEHISPLALAGHAHPSLAPHTRTRTLHLPLALLTLESPSFINSNAMIENSNILIDP